MKQGFLSARPQTAVTHWAIIGLFVMMAVGALSFAQSFFIPVVFAMLLALILSPIRRFLGQLGIGPGVAAAIIMTVFCAISVTLLFLISSSLSTIVSDEPQLMNKVQERMNELTGVLEPMRQAGEQLEQMQNSSEAPERVVVREEGIFSLWAETTPYIAGQVGLAIVLATFLIASGDMFYEKLVQVMPDQEAKRKALTIARDMERQLSTYFLTITAINGVLGICVGLVMWALGMPDPVFFGVAAFALNYIPYIGSIIGIFFAFMMGVVTYDNIWLSLAPPFAYWLINSAEGQFITPVAVGKRLRLNAVAVFLSVAFWAWLWSFVGMFLSTPMLIALKAFSDRNTKLSWLSTFLGRRSDCEEGDSAIVHDVMEPGTDACDAGLEEADETASGHGDEEPADPSDRPAPALS
ncbi:AI-2E family transporter [Henriciella aquimarina]|uniref:AI-2E family transporter n=1 Tax=Henriciella aquimarina TaxID=545261 RepID=UPI000A020E86|nr:AI-2E family transporter [Henriciella aquimarina]